MDQLIKFSLLMLLILLTACNGIGVAKFEEIPSEVVEGLPVFSYATSTGTNGTLNSPVSVSPSSDDFATSPLVSCIISPVLPAGLSIDNGTCVVSGTPTVTLASTLFTVTATNSIGESTADLTLSVSDRTPILSYIGSAGTSGVLGAGMSVTPTTLNDLGLPISSCLIAPPLPSGLLIHNTTCVISGTPTVTLASTDFTVTVTNAAGSANDSVTLLVSPNVPDISYASSTGVTGAFGSPMSVTPSTLVTNGAAITNCMATPSLPAWATLNTSTCVITGTPNALLSATVYAVTASNSAGSSTAANVTLEVPDEAPVSSDITPANFDQDVESIITLSYSDLESHQASSCAVSSLTNITVTTACSCMAGTCTVGVTGTTYYAGAASFTYTVTANGLTSNSATASFTIDSTAFVSTWRTTSTNETVTLPLRTGFTYNATINWGDGTANSVVTASSDASRIHTYASAGTYTITINGTFQTIYFNTGGDKLKILTIPNLGKVGWTSFENAFYGCTNLTTVNGGDTSLVTSMKWMFRSATNVVPDTSGWNTSNVTSMTYLFFGNTSANPNVSNWNTANVTDMSSMFYGASSANPDTTNWNTGNVTNMANLFRSAASSNPNVSGWDTSKVTNMSYMFYGLTNATPITTTSGNIWNTGNVTNMSFMFYGATIANPDTSNWNTGKVTNMDSMFMSTQNANPNTTNWNTALVTNMNSMFYNAKSANPDTTNWNTGNVTDMGSMFRGATIATPNTANWNTAKVTDMGSMFYGASLANPVTTTSGNIWNTANVTKMSYMFYQARVATPNTTNWNTAKVTTMNYMFGGAWAATPVTSNWNTSLVTNMKGMFYGATLANPDTSLWNTANVTDMSSMFRDAFNATPDTSGWITTNVTDMANMFDYATLANPITTGWNTSNVTSMSYMFSDAVNASPNTSGWDTSKVTDMAYMFQDASSANPNTSGWDTSKVTRMLFMFDGATVANPNTSGWNTSLVTDMSYMFQDAPNAIPNTSGWDTSQVTNMFKMFYRASSANPNTSGWNTSNVTNMGYLFSGVTNGNPNVSGWNTSKVTNMSYMFQNTNAANPNVRNWDVSKVTTMAGMFYTAVGVVNVDTSLWTTSALTDLTSFVRGTTTACPIFTSWDFTKVTTYTNLGLSGNICTVNYSDLLLTLNTQKAFLPNGVTLSVNTTKYKSYATAARDALINTKGWTFSDGGLDPDP